MTEMLSGKKATGTVTVDKLKVVAASNSMAGDQERRAIQGDLADRRAFREESDLTVVALHVETY